MKKYLIFIVFTLILFGCGYETPKLNDNESPFVVEKIKKYDNTHSSYYNNSTNLGTGSDNFFGHWRSKIILPNNMYNIGDTIKVVKYEH